MSVDPRHRFDREFAGLSPAQVMGVVGRATHDALTMKTDGKHAITDRDLQNLQVAQLGLTAMIQENTAIQAANPMGKALMGQARDFALTSLATAAGGPAMGAVVGGALMAKQVFNMVDGGGSAPAPMAHQRSPHHNPSSGYFGGQKGSAVTAPAVPMFSFAEESDQRRGGPAKPAHSRPGVSSRLSPRRAFGARAAQQPPNVFDQKLAGAVTLSQSQAAARQLAKVKRVSDNVSQLVTGERKMDVTGEGVLPTSTLNRMGAENRCDIFKAHGKVSLPDTGTVSQEAIRSFTEFQAKPHQMAALAPGLG